MGCARIAMDQTSRLVACGFIILSVFIAHGSSTASVPVYRGIPLACRLREYTDYRAEKPGCRPQAIVVDACYGFCDTFQVPALRPPFKHSQHKMCSYGDTYEETIQLNDCDPGVDRSYTYLHARNCVCRKCSPANTFCLGII